MRRSIHLVWILAIVSMLGACGSKEVTVQAAAKDAPSIKTTMINMKGNKIGSAELSAVTEGVKIHLVADKLPPGMHGIHFHEVGLCEKPDFVSSGMHLNPLNKQHGFDNPQGFHAGDLPNIQVGSDGKINVDIISKTVTLDKGMPNSLLRDQGVSLIIHEKSDDLLTDPSGNSGSRIACGVIK